MLPPPLKNLSLTMRQELSDISREMTVGAERGTNMTRELTGIYKVLKEVQENVERGGRYYFALIVYQR